MYLNSLDIQINYEQLLKEFTEILKPKAINNQLSLQARVDTPKDKQLTEGCGSLYWNWDDYDENTMDKPPKHDIELNEKDFVVAVDLIKNTYTEKLLYLLVKKYNIHRTRLMCMKSRAALSWHRDYSKRLHIPLVTSSDSFMVVEDTKIHIPYGKAHIVDTTLYHTAVNCGLEDRWHIVGCVS